MKKLIMTIVLGMAAASYAASPALTGVSVQQNSSRLVTITYNVDQECIVTVDVLTNGVSIGEVNFTNMTGAVNKQVSAGQNVICWQPRDSWADQRVAAGGISVNVKAWPLCAPPPYMVVDLYQEGNGYLNDGVYVHYFASTNAFPGGFENRAYKTTTIVMRHIPAAGVRWRMGMSAADQLAYGDLVKDKIGSSAPFNDITYAQSETAHYVTLTNDYWIAVYPLTQAQAKRCSQNGDAYIANGFVEWEGRDRDLYPMEGRQYDEMRGSVANGVNWPETGDKVAGFLSRFRSRTGGMKFDFPTEAQWEFACRAGESGQLYDGTALYVDGARIANSRALIAELGWIYYTYNDDGTAIESTRTYPVGLKKPNNWGLYDMIGNVSEFCLDWYDVFTAGDIVDPRGPDGVRTHRVVRGGSYATSFFTTRSSSRRILKPSSGSPDQGCRLSITIP